MKVAERVLDVTSTIQGEKIDMTIDPQAMVHIMSVLTDLYSDQEFACLREYSTNAFDAHVEAGQKRPIEVTLPSPLSPFLTIRDYGIGMDRDDIADTYSKYGASTKRDSNDVVGMLGLGSKSALTYTDQFTVVGIKNGIMTTISVSRNEEGSASMTIPETHATDEPSGVEIIIPAKRGNQFDEKAKKFFQFWQPGTVLVNGEEPKRVEGTWIADDLLLTRETDRSYVVMGNVAYPMLEDINASYYGYDRIYTVAFVNIGDVFFTPSRESLQSDRKTKDKLAEIQTRVKKEKNPAFERIIAACTTKQEAYKKFREVQRVGYDGKNPMWNGKPLPLSWKHASEQFLLSAPGRKYRGIRGTGKEQRIVNSPESFLILNNFSGSEMTAYKRTKLDLYRERMQIEIPETYIMIESLDKFEPVYSDQAGVAATQALFAKHDKFTEWFPKDRILDWNIIEKEKVIRENTQRSDGRPSGSYHGVVAGTQNRQILAKDIDTSKPIFYERGQTGYWGVIESAPIKTLMKIEPDATIIVLGQNRIKKFTRDFPMARNVSEYLRAEAKAWQDKLTEDDKLYLHFADERYMKQNLATLKSVKDKIDDPELVKAIDLATTPCPPNLFDEWNRWQRWGARYSFKFVNPLDKYVLLTNLSYYGNLNGESQEHLHIYLNAAFAHESQTSTKEV